MAKRVRRVGSIKGELIKKSRESALSAVQIFNNPNISFKSESFIVLVTIAWTYLLHAYYRSHGIEYRYFKWHGKVRRFDKTKYGADKHWELERCINCNESPLDASTSNNLRFIIGLRHEIEHQMTSRIDDTLSARFQACVLNYNQYVKAFFGNDYGIEKHLAFSLQFSTIDTEQKDLLEDHPGLPANIKGYISNFDESLTDGEYADPRYAYRILFVPKTANRKGQADRVIEFVPSDSDMAEAINKEYALIKETEKKKYLPSQIVAIMQKEGFDKFSIYHHTQLWKNLDAKNKGKGYGYNVAGKQWLWYGRWVEEVRKHCKDNHDAYVSQ